MKSHLFLFSLLWSASLAKIDVEYKLEKVEVPKGRLQDLSTIKYFNELVRENNFNISILISKNQNIGQFKLEGTVGITFPLNKLAVSNRTLTEPQSRKFVETATLEKLAAKVILNTEKQKQGWSNNPNAVPEIISHRIFQTIKNGRAEFEIDVKNYIAFYTFLTPAENETKEATNVAFGDIEVEYIKSANFSNEHIDLSKQILANAYFLHTPNTFGKAIKASYKQLWPDERWNVVVDSGKNNFIKAQKLIELKMFGTKYLIYSV